jgi:Holliday junction resolvase RusA-like endonuclease
MTMTRADIKRRKLDQKLDDAEWSFVLDLPRPPSVNRFIRKLGNRTPSVRAWIAEADYQLYAARAPHRGRPTEITVMIIGAYEVEFILQRPPNRKFDLDNCIKPLMDWLQRAGLIEDDKYCERLVAVWGRAPLGVKVRLREWSP